jgi:uncharacterized Tic20 family protein
MDMDNPPPASVTADPQAPDPVPRPEKTPQEERTWAMACHLAALAWFVIPPLGHLLGPLLVWLLKRNEYPSVNRQGKEALNFQISITLYSIPLMGLLVTVIFTRVAIPGLLALTVLYFVGLIRATLQANRDEIARYPLSIRLIK